MSTPTALITGASRGLGLALARALAGRGWQLIIDARDARGLRAAADALSPARVVHIAGDVNDPGGAQRVGGGAQAARVAGVDDQLPAATGQRAGQRQAQPTRGPGDQGGRCRHRYPPLNVEASCSTYHIPPARPARRPAGSPASCT